MAIEVWAAVWQNIGRTVEYNKNELFYGRTAQYRQKNIERRKNLGEEASAILHRRPPILDRSAGLWTGGQRDTTQGASAILERSAGLWTGGQQGIEQEARSILDRRPAGYWA